jgi:hypothetical protein
MGEEFYPISLFFFTGFDALVTIPIWVITIFIVIFILVFFTGVQLVESHLNEEDHILTIE